MAAFKTLSELQEKTKKKERVSDENRIPKFFPKLNDGESRRVRFRQELSEDSKGYDEGVGGAELVEVHASPADFKKKAICTGSDGKCWGCEQIPDDFKWKPKSHILVNVAVEDTDDNGKTVWVPRVLDQRFSSQQIGQDLVEHASLRGTLTDRDYIIKRSGSGTSTTYQLLPLDPSEEPAEVAELPMHELDGFFRKLPYGQQEAFYLGIDDQSTPSGW